TLSPDRRLVVFASLRRGNPITLKIKGLGGARTLYAYEIETGRMRTFAPSLDKKYPAEMSQFTQIRWSPKRSELFFSSIDKIFSISPDQDSLRTVYQDTSIDVINEFAFAPDGEHIILQYLQKNTADLIR